MSNISTRLASSAIHGAPMTERTPGQREATRERLRVERARKVKAIAKQKRRIAKRQAIGDGWDGRAANDNIAWPLATALIKEGNTDLLKYAMLYRRIHADAKSNAMLGGSNVTIGDGMALDRHIHVRPDGSVAYKHVRQSTAADKDIPSRKKAITDSEAQLTSDKAESGYTSVPKPWKGDAAVNSKIDAQRKLGRLQSALGHLCEPFELACVDGKTLAEVGETIGIVNRSGAQGAGRALVHTALITLRDIFGEVSRRELVA